MLQPCKASNVSYIYYSKRRLANGRTSQHSYCFSLCVLCSTLCPTPPSVWDILPLTSRLGDWIAFCSDISSLARGGHRTPADFFIRKKLWDWTIDWVMGSGKQSAILDLEKNANLENCQFYRKNWLIVELMFSEGSWLLLYQQHKASSPLHYLSQMSTLTLHCQWGNEMSREKTGHPLSLHMQENEVANASFPRLLLAGLRDCYSSK